jgi:transposase
MHSDKRSAQVERLEVVDTGRRRRWSEDEKLKIVLESLQTPRQISATARRYGISRSLLIRWRRAFRAERHDAAEQQFGFVSGDGGPGTRGGGCAKPARSAAGRSRSSLRPGFGCGSRARSMRRR